MNFTSPVHPKAYAPRPVHPVTLLSLAKAHDGAVHIGRHCRNPDLERGRKAFREIGIVRQPHVEAVERCLDLLALMACCDCYVSLHRSEGFGRGPAEAMLLGKPVILTDYSGTRDFATAETALLVGCELVPVGKDEYPGADGQVWTAPDIAEAAAAMRRIAADRMLARRLGRAGQARIRELYDPTVVGRRYLDHFAALARTT